MKEIEVLIDFKETKEEMLEILSQFKYEGEKQIFDTYYIDPLRDNLKPSSNLRTSELFRIRKEDETTYITYKEDHFKGNRWIYSDEFETIVEDHETIKKIIKMLGLEEYVTVTNTRKFYTYKNFHIIFEEVKELGLFLEVEQMIGDDLDPHQVKDEIRDFIRSLNIHVIGELDLGKNQMALKKKLNITPIKEYQDEIKY